MTMFPTVRGQVMAAAERRAHVRRLPLTRLDLSAPGWLALGGVLVLVVMSLAVGAGALFLLSSHGAKLEASGPAGVQQTRQQLINNLSVLRRPQVPADRDPQFLPGPFENVKLNHRRPPLGFRPVLARWGYPIFDRPLARVVEVPALNARVALEPATWRPSASSSHRVEGLDVMMRIGAAKTIPPSTEFGTGPRPTSVGTLLAHGIVLSGPLAGGRGEIAGAIVVPDGVARVTLRPIRLIGRPVVSLDLSRFSTISEPVHDNVATFTAPLPTTVDRTLFSGTYGFSAVAKATWFDTQGKVVKNTTTQLDLLIRVKGKGRRPLPPGATHRRSIARSRFCRLNPRAC
jgi:hypothetical protein